ncbi:MAG: peptide ABC transporter permease [Candidatus Hydrogenedentota bacterium]|nr:MAG: peptide ABC transporter permease [Candidatus Hydrogenedentota bacterium]
MRQSYWAIVFRQFRRNKLAVAASVVLVLLFGIAIFAPFLAGEKPIYLEMDGETYWLPNLFKYEDLVSMQFDRWEPGENDRAVYAWIPHAPERSNLRNRLQGPSADHLLGTDDRGRDILSRLIWGTQISMSVGFMAVGVAIFMGVIMGAAAGFYGGKVDMVILRIIEIMLCFPSLILILALIAYLGRSIWIIMLVIGIIGSPDVARLVRGEYLKLRSSDFATAAKATGLSDIRIMFRHILPNAMAPVLVNATFGVAGAILTESALSFLGLGVRPPTASWGEILSQSKAYVDYAWWLVVFPGFAIFITVTAFNLVGEGLRDAMDPKLRQ